MSVSGPEIGVLFFSIHRKLSLRFLGTLGILQDPRRPEIWKWKHSCALTRSAKPSSGHLHFLITCSPVTWTTDWLCSTPSCPNMWGPWTTLRNILRYDLYGRCAMGFFFFFLNKDLIPSLWKMFLKKWYEIKEHFYLKKKYVYCFLMVVKFYLRVHRRSFPILMVHLQRHYQTCIVQLSLSAVNNSQEKTISYS